MPPPETVIRQTGMFERSNFTMNGCLMPDGRLLLICWMRWMISFWPLFRSAS